MYCKEFKIKWFFHLSFCCCRNLWSSIFIENNYNNNVHSMFKSLIFYFSKILNLFFDSSQAKHITCYINQVNFFHFYTEISYWKSIIFSLEKHEEFVRIMDSEKKILWHLFPLFWSMIMMTNDKQTNWNEFSQILLFFGFLLTITINPFQFQFCFFFSFKSFSIIGLSRIGFWIHCVCVFVVVVFFCRCNHPNQMPTKKNKNWFVLGMQ